ncbi:MAG: DUF3823 domain-containing protein [Muribaculaceae bacterium]
MKKNIIFSLLSLLLLIGVSACETDNYDGPKETFRGAFIDKVTKQPFQSAIGNTGIRIRMMEYSWSDNPKPYDFNCMMDGTFNNTKIFAGTYGLEPEGAFVPLDLKNERFKIAGTYEKILRVEWIGEPSVNADGTADVKVKITRGTDNPDYQQAIEEAWLFVSETGYVGDFSFSNRFSTQLVGGAVSNILDKEITIRTKGQFPTYSRKFFLRVGARTTKKFSGTNRYNYTTIKEITTIAR